MSIEKMSSSLSSPSAAEAGAGEDDDEGISIRAVLFILEICESDRLGQFDYRHTKRLDFYKTGLVKFRFLCFLGTKKEVFFFNQTIQSNLLGGAVGFT